MKKNKIVYFAILISLFICGAAITVFAFSTNENADVALGQPNMTSSASNNGGLNANTLYTPYSVFSDGTRLYIADTTNNRVLIFNTIPTSSYASANVVVGQPNMTSNAANNGGLGANTLNQPQSVFSDGTKLYIADTNNNRILIYNSIPASNGASANVVVGQPDMTTNSSGCSATGINKPYSVHTDGTKLYIADHNNNRVLIYNSIPASNGASANVVVGQADMVSSGTGCNANGLYGPSSAFSDGTKLYIADSYQHRIQIFNTIPAANFATANVSVGQPNLNTCNPNNGGIGANTLDTPFFVSTDGTKLYIADYNNHRVLIYNTIPGASNANANVVIGQPNMTSNTANNGGIGANTLNFPSSVFLAGPRLFVADTTNNRGLIYVPPVNERGWVTFY